MSKQGSLFENINNSEDLALKEAPQYKEQPLAYQVRPKDLDLFIGQEHIFKRFPFLAEANFPSLLLWGPPGCGKTTLAHILAIRSGKELYKFNAVLGGVNDLKKLIARALEVQEYNGKEVIIFIDEIHRFNKAQQDALLPYIEEGAFILIGATTEAPRRSVNKALLSRMKAIELKPLETDHLETILNNTLKITKKEVGDEIIKFIADYAGGDARTALNHLDIVLNRFEDPSKLALNDVKPLILENARDYDKSGNRHYDVISAFIKSMRGTDPDAAILWLAVMLDGGEDPVFVARRLVIFASEDVGNADPQALQVAVSCLQAVQNIGMPEARINLAQATTYLASTVKSNAAYKAINEALDFVAESPTIEVPDHLKNFPPKNAPKYLYPHSYPGHYVEQEYTKGKIPQFYKPTELGIEGRLKERLNTLKKRT